MNKKELTSSIAACCVFVFFSYIIPISVIQNHKAFFSIVGGLSIGTILFFGLKPNPKKKYIIDLYKKEKRKEYLYVFILIGAAVFSFFYIYLHNITRKANLLEKTGELTMGSISTGVATEKQVRLQKITDYKITVEYNVDGSDYSFQSSINKSDWQNSYQGQPVAVLYSPKYPDIATPILSKDDVSRFGIKKIRPLTITDLLKLFNGRKNLDSTLKCTSFAWYKPDLNSTYFFYNPIYNSYLYPTEKLLIYEQVNIIKGKINDDETFLSNYNYLKNKYRVVYDSMNSNVKKEALFMGNNNFIKCQVYTDVERDSPISMHFLKKSVIGIFENDAPIILPSDTVQPLSSREEMILKTLTQ